MPYNGEAIYTKPVSEQFVDIIIPKG